MHLWLNDREGRLHTEMVPIDGERGERGERRGGCRRSLPTN